MPKGKDQKILELEDKSKLLEKRIAFLEKQAERSDKKAIFFDMIFDMIIDMAEKSLIFLSEKTPYPNSRPIQ